MIIFKSFLFVLPTGSGAEKTYDAYDMQSVCRARRARLDGIRFYGQVKKKTIAIEFCLIKVEILLLTHFPTLFLETY